MQTTSPSEIDLCAIEREIIDDILAVCRRCGWPTNVRPSFQAYLDQRGHFYEKQIKRLGGWKKLCALGGMHTGPMRVLPVPQGAAAPDFDRVLADVRLVAQSLRLKPGAPLTRAVYLRSGGLYNEKTLIKLGGWAAFSAAAGVPSRKGQRSERLRRKWQKSTGVWCGAVELTPSELTPSELKGAESTSDPSASPAKPATAVTVTPTMGQMFISGVKDPNFWRKRAMKRKSIYYRPRLAAIARRAAGS